MNSPLHRLEHRLEKVVPFLIVPISGFANAGVPLFGVGRDAGGTTYDWRCRRTGLFGSAAIAIRFGVADLPTDATWTQLFGTALLCGIGFTMSLFIGLLALAGSPVLQEEMKLGLLCGSLLADLLGTVVLLTASRQRVGAAKQ